MEMEFSTCIRCGRPLKTQESRTYGMGKTCREKYLREKKERGLFNAVCNTRISKYEQIIHSD